MRPPDFWARSPRHPLALLLAPAGAAYGQLTAARMDRDGHRAPCPVLCIGNFTLGGAGKTPTALRIADILAELGARPAFLTRGYGGRFKGPIVVDPARHTAEEVGDEPLLLARKALTVVAQDRIAGAELCLKSGADVIVMDDGLQNPHLHKDLALAVVDAGFGVGNARTFPAGPLRVPLRRQWRHVGGLVLIGEGAPGEAIAREAEKRGLPVHRARLGPLACDFAGKAVLAFAGIGRPEKFFATLRETGADLVETRSFPDHHPYSASDLATLETAARKLGAMLVTTEKDRVRLPLEARSTIASLQVGLVFTGEGALRARLSTLLQGFRSVR